MLVSGLRSAVALLLAVCVAVPAVAAGAKIPKSVLVESARMLPGGRGVVVTVAQGELASNINPSMATVVLAGGLIGALIDAKVDSDRGKRAQAGITPVRVALMDFDTDQLAMDVTTAAATANPGFVAQNLPFTRDPTPSAKSALLDKAAQSQVAFFDYVYDTAPDFASIRVGLTITMAATAIPAGAAPVTRLSNRNLAYVQTLTSVVQLAHPSDPATNAQAWAAHDGAMAKQALKLGFAQVGALVPRALALTVDDLARFKAAEKTSAGYYSGKLVEQNAGGTLMFGAGFIHVQIYSE